MNRIKFATSFLLISSALISVSGNGSECPEKNIQRDLGRIHTITGLCNSADKTNRFAMVRSLYYKTDIPQDTLKLYFRPPVFDAEGRFIGLGDEILIASGIMRSNDSTDARSVIIPPKVSRSSVRRELGARSKK